MSKIIDNFDIDANFWELNKDLKVVEPFKSLYKNDKTRNKQWSSMAMWFVALCFDFDSKYFNIDEEERVRLIGKDWCKDEEFYYNNRSTLDNIIDMYCHIFDTAAQRALREWNNKMLERARFMKVTLYTPDTYDTNEFGKRIPIKGTAELLDKMMGNTKKLYDDLKRINEELSKEELAAVGKGGKTASLSDAGEI